MTAQPPFDPGAYRSDAVPSDTQAIYIQEGGAEPRGILFHSPTKHPKILRLQEIMIVSALLCLIHGVISSFAPDNLSPLKGLPEFGVQAVSACWLFLRLCTFGCTSRFRRASVWA